MTASIMCATFNRIELTKLMLESLFKETSAPYRLLIVDNGSTDGTPEFLKKTLSEQSYCQYELQFNEKNLGIAMARNQGLIMASKYNDEWLSTIDNDIEFVPDWLNKCIEIIQEVPKLALGLNMEGRVYPYKTVGDKMFQVKNRGNLGTACTVFHRDLHDKIGFFTTEFGLYGEEDADFFFRAKLAGWELGYLIEMGKHLGEGAADEGDYRDFKTKCHNENYQKFLDVCREYSQKKRDLKVNFDNERK